MKEERLGVLVLGMHRSGTSAVTGLFTASGYFVGAEQELMKPDWGNPAGYHERLDTLATNERIMADLGGSWIDPPRPEIQRDSTTALARVAQVFTTLLEQAAGRPIAVKDPRIATLMPLWGPVLADRLHPVIVVRDPLEIAASLRARGGTPEPLGLAGWEMHAAGILEACAGQVVTVAHYDAVVSSLQAARAVVASATTHLAPGLRTELRISDGAGWLRADLRHNRSETDVHEEHLTGHQLRIWEFLRALPHGEILLDPPPEVTRVSPAARASGHAEALRLGDVKALQDLRAERDVLSDRLPAGESSSAGQRSAWRRRLRRAS